MTSVRLWKLVRVAFILSSATVIGCAQVEPPDPQQGVTDVSISNIAFDPRSVTIRVGESVRWTNLEGVPIPHTATSGEPGDPDGLWDSGTLSSGESFTRTFDEPGEFVYFCEFHPTVQAMVGATVVVEP